jgi:hypothetical protein
MVHRTDDFTAQATPVARGCKVIRAPPYIFPSCREYAGVRDNGFTARGEQCQANSVVLGSAIIVEACSFARATTCTLPSHIQLLKSCMYV